MRITNKIMQRNNLSNINTNKIYQDRLSTQMSTQKKINRPSDDPVVAIRALRLRSNVTEVTQYYSKNIPDAKSWLSVTEGALDNLSEIITKMIEECTKGSNGDLTTSNRQIILEQLKALGDEVYATGDVDYAGRFVFTGYRTDTSLSFTEEQELRYSITEQVDKSIIDSVTKVQTGKVKDINSANFNDTGTGMADITEQDISSVEVYRIRLAYNDCSDDYTAGGDIKIEFTDPALPTPDPFAPNTEWSLANGDIKIMHTYDDPDPYTEAANDDNAKIYVPETGEILLGKESYKKLMETKDSEQTKESEAEIRITYDKSSWKKGDLRPEHYFACTSYPDKDDPTAGIVYNDTFLGGDPERQEIEYDVGFNQTIRVNSTADECFKHGIGREVDDIVSAMQDVLDLEGIKANIESMLKKIEPDSDDEKILKNQLEAVDKALTLAKDKEQRLFEGGITAFQGHLDETDLSITNCGTRSSKLALIENRMQNQKTTFETLKSENEDIDITEVAIQLSSAELTYEAALMAAGKVMQTSLLNFI